MRGHEQTGAAAQLFDRGLGDDAAVRDDSHPVADLLHLGHEVAGEDDGAALAAQLDHEGAHVAHAGRVEPVGRLVEDHQLGVLEQGGGDAEALLHPERVRGEPVVAAIGEADRG
jgi:hypothetical protein